MAACSDPGQCSKKSIPISVHAPVLTPVADGVPGRCPSALVLHKQASLWLHRLERQIFEPLSPSPQGRSLPFLTVVCQIKNPLLFLQLPVFQRPSSFWSWAVKQLICPAQVLPPARRQETSRLWGRQVAEPPCSFSVPTTALPSAPAPALQRALLSPVAAQASMGTCLSQHLLCPKHTHYCSWKRGARRLLGRGEGEAHSYCWLSMLWLHIHRAFPHSGKEMCILKGLTLCFLDPTTLKTAYWLWWTNRC